MDPALRFMTPMMLRILALHASGYQLKEIVGMVYLSYPRITGIAGDAKRGFGTRTLAGACAQAHALGYLSHPTGPDGSVVVLDTEHSTGRAQGPAQAA
jgi:hypothetical protein